MGVIVVVCAAFGLTASGAKAEIMSGAYTTHDAASGSTPSNCTTDRAFPSSSKSGC